MASERILFEVNFDTAAAQKSAIEYGKQVDALKAQQKALNKSFQELEISEEDYRAETEKLRSELKQATDAQKSYQRQVDLSIKANVAAEGSYEQITAELKLLEAELRKAGNTMVLQADGTYEVNEAYKDQIERVRKLKEAQLAFDGAIKDGRSNVGNYDTALKGITDRLSIFGISIGEGGKSIGEVFTQGVNTAKGALNALYKAVLANPITAIILLIVGAVIAVVKAFADTDRGANKIAQTFARLQPILSVVQSVLAAIGEVLFTVVDAFAQATIALTGFSKQSEESAKLVKNLQDVEKRLVRINSLEKERKAEAERLKNIRDDESRNTQERIDANNKLRKVEDDRYKMLVGAEKEKLAIMEEQLKKTPENLHSLEQAKQIEEQRAKVAEISEDYYSRINEQITEGNSLLRDQQILQTEINTALLEQDILRGKIAKGSAQELAERQKLIAKNLDAQLLVFDKEKKLQGLSRDERLKVLSETNDQAKKLIVESQNEQLTLEKDFREEWADKYKEALEKQKEARGKYIEDQLAIYELEAARFKEGTIARLEAEKMILRAQSQARIETEELTNNQILLERQNLDNAIAEKDAQIAEIKKAEHEKELNETQVRLQREADLEQVGVDKRIALLTFESERRIANEGLTGEALKLEVSKTEQAIADLKEEQRKKDFEQYTLSIENEKNAQLGRFEAQKLAIEQETQNEFVKNEKILELRTQHLAELQNAEQEALRAKFEFEMEFTAQTEAEKDALRVQYANDYIELQRRYSNETIELNKAISESDLSRLENAQTVFGGLKGLFQENSTAYKFAASAEALISTYLGANKALGSAPPPFNFILAALTTAQGLLNVAKINGVETFATGGLLTFDTAPKTGTFGGKPHSQGGTKLYSPQEGRVYEVESNEAFAIVNKKDAGMIGSLSNLNARNGIPFANGGLLTFDSTPIVNIGRETITTAQVNQAIIASMPTPILKVSDLWEVENNVKVSERISNQ
ncbi:MAG: hypothetical protein ACRCXN_12890 [Bacteroidales bacterium]